MLRRQVMVGCAGWSIPSAHAHLFGPGESTLARYATRFAIVEINSSFYRPHQFKTYQRWARAVPRAFRFSVKLPQTISHAAALRGAGPLLDQLLPQAEGLGEKLAGFLLQLPPSLVLDARVAAAFFRSFRNRSDAALVCEPRHLSWFSAKADDLFQRYQVSQIGADPPRAPAAGTPQAEADWPYWRWHGAPRMYYSNYSDQALHALARQVQAYRNSQRAPWVIFDNTAHGFAVANAASLQDLLTAKATPVSTQGHMNA